MAFTPTKPKPLGSDFLQSMQGAFAPQTQPLAAATVAPQGMTSQPQVDPQTAIWMKILERLGQTQQQPFDLSALLHPQGQHLGVGGGEITPQNPQGYAGGNPFESGFFKTQPQRAAREQEVLGQPGITGASPEQRLAAMRQTLMQTQQAGLPSPYAGAGQVVPPMYGPSQNLPPVANPNELSAFERMRKLLPGSLPLGTMLTPYGSMSRSR